MLLWFVISFGVIAFYDIFFEVFRSGQTPGKRLNGLRVVRVEGHPVTFLSSAVRNILRPIDFLPSGYLLGAIVILSTHKNQRIGDVVAGTLVVRAGGRAPSPAASPRAIGAPASPQRPTTRAPRKTGRSIRACARYQPASAPTTVSSRRRATAPLISKQIGSTTRTRSSRKRDGGSAHSRTAAWQTVV